MHAVANGNHPAAGASLEDRFNAIAAEWHVARRSAGERRLEGWETSLVAMATEEAALRTAQKWQTGPADFLGVVGRARDEVTHSMLLGWLLDSAGRHGLGNRMAAALLSRLGLEVADEDHFIVRLEVTAEKSRADIILSSGDVKVVIENKVDAMEHRWQCELLAADHPGAQTLIFLTPTGRPPTTASADDHWYSMRWSVIGDLLDSALRETGPAPGRHIAEDYLSTLRREMP